MTKQNGAVVGVGQRAMPSPSPAPSDDHGDWRTETLRDLRRALAQPRLSPRLRLQLADVVTTLESETEA